MTIQPHNLSRLLACALAGVLMMGASADAKELLKNRKFTGALSPWVISWHDGKAKDLDVEGGKGEIRIRVPGATKASYLRLMQPVRIKEGKTYTLTFEAKSDAGALDTSPMVVMVAQRKPRWESYGLKQKQHIEAEWNAYTYTFTATKIDSKNEPVLRLNVGNIDGNVFLRKLSLVDE